MQDITKALQDLAKAVESNATVQSVSYYHAEKAEAEQG